MGKTASSHPRRKYSKKPKNPERFLLGPGIHVTFFAYNGLGEKSLLVYYSSIEHHLEYIGKLDWFCNCRTASRESAKEGASCEGGSGWGMRGFEEDSRCER